MTSLAKFASQASAISILAWPVSTRPENPTCFLGRASTRPRLARDSYCSGRFASQDLALRATSISSGRAGTGTRTLPSLHRRRSRPGIVTVGRALTGKRIGPVPGHIAVAEAGSRLLSTEAPLPLPRTRSLPSRGRVLRHGQDCIAMARRYPGQGSPLGHGKPCWAWPDEGWYSCQGGPSLLGLSGCPYHGRIALFKASAPHFATSSTGL